MDDVLQAEAETHADCPRQHGQRTQVDPHEAQGDVKPQRDKGVSRDPGDGEAHAFVEVGAGQGSLHDEPPQHRFRHENERAQDEHLQDARQRDRRVAQIEEREPQDTQQLLKQGGFHGDRESGDDERGKETVLGRGVAADEANAVVEGFLLLNVTNFVQACNHIVAVVRHEQFGAAKTVAKVVGAVGG